MALVTFAVLATGLAYITGHAATTAGEDDIYVSRGKLSLCCALSLCCVLSLCGAVAACDKGLTTTEPGLWQQAVCSEPHARQHHLALAPPA